MSLKTSSFKKKRRQSKISPPNFKYMSGETITLEGGMGLRP